MGLHGNAIGNIYTSTEQAQAIRRLFIKRLMDPIYELPPKSEEYWAKAVDFGVYGSTDAEQRAKGEDPLTSDKREGAMRIMGAYKVRASVCCLTF